MKNIEITGLFNRFDYNIEFGKQEIQMLTGPNGFGKSTILRCIKAFSDSNLNYFFTLPFKSLIMQNNENGKELVITKRFQKELVVDEKYLITEEKINNFMRTSKYEFVWDVFESDETENAKGHLKNVTKDDYYKINRKMKEIVGEVFFIEEQRLIQKKQSDRTKNDWDILKIYKTQKISGEWDNVIEHIPDKIKGYFEVAAGEYANKANSLDATYPQRLFDDSDDSFSEEEYARQLEIMNTKLDKLKKYEISQFGKMDAQYKAKYEKALKIYFEDFNEKYKTYEQLIEQLDMFTEMVNKRLYFDEIRIDKNKGCVVANKKDAGTILKLDKLSSGEKETIVLFYKLIFEVRKGSLLLLDEPEISLHVAWQRMFAEDMYTIAKKRGIKILAATHAPMIINGNQDVQIDLGEQHGRACNRFDQAGTGTDHVL